MAEPRELTSPWILAVETSTRIQSVAVACGEAIRSEESARGERGGSETLLRLVDAALAGAGLELADVDAFAVSIGPGSFTGLRIGLATVKGLAFDSRRPVAAVPTLEALALGASVPERVVAPVLDARRGEVYAAGYALGDPEAGALREILPPGVFTPASLASVLPRPCTLLGDGVPVCRQALWGPDTRDLHFGSTEPARASSVARLGARMLARGRGQAADGLAPRYLRRAEAEVKRTGERFESDSTPP